MAALLIERVRGIHALLADLAESNEKQRGLGPDTVRALQRVDAFRLFVPPELDGPGVTSREALDALIAISSADAAAGWCATVASQTSHIAGSLDPIVASRVFGQPLSIANGAFAPNGLAQSADGGYRVSGRWAWGSGCRIADWITVGALTSDKHFLQMIFPASAVIIHDNWDPAGLAGTGSHDFTVDNVFVPSEHCIQFGRTAPTSTSTVARTPGFVLFAAGIAGVIIGIAERACEEVLAVSKNRKPAQSSKTVAESPVAQAELARVQANVRAARLALASEVDQVTAIVERGDRVPVENRLQVRVSATHAAEVCVDVVSRCFALGGGSAVHRHSVLQRCLRDAHTAAAHIMVSPRSYETAGRHAFGLPIDANSL